MTTEEAKDLLDNLIGMLTDNHNSDYDTALKMGIKALEKSKKPEYQCQCYCQYPNKHHKCKNGHWKCVDNYRPIEKAQRNSYSPVTYCKRIDVERSDHHGKQSLEQEQKVRA